MKFLIMLFTLFSLCFAPLFADDTDSTKSGSTGAEHKVNDSQISNKFKKMVSGLSTAGGAGYGSGVSKIPLNKQGGTSYDFCAKLIGKSKSVSADANSLPETITSALREKNGFGFDQEEDYTSSSALSVIKKSINMATEAVECAAILVTLDDSEPLEDPSQYGSSESSKSMDGTISCRSEGLTTIDYPACTRAITAYNSFYLGQQAMDAYQEIDLQKTNIEEQSKVNANDASSALNAQQASINKQSEQMKQKAMAQAAKAATLYEMIRRMPTKDSIASTCMSNNKKKAISATATSIKALLQKRLKTASLKKRPSSKNMQALQQYGFKVTSSNSRSTLQIADFNSINEEQYNYFGMNDDEIIPMACDRAASLNNVAPNTKAIDQLKMALANSGIAVARHLMVANMLDDRSNQIEDMKNKLSNYNPADNGFSFLPAKLAKFCEENPTDSRCAAGLPQGASTFGTAGMNIQFGDAGGATTFEQGTLHKGNDWTAKNSATNSGLGSDIAPRFAPSAQKGGGFNGAGRPAAAVKTSDVNKAGGGGGGAPGGVSAPSGGNIQQPGAQGNYANYKSKLKQPTYSGGGKITYSRAARNIKNKKKSSSSNPFSKMFGKKRNSQNMNFRSLASKQISRGGSIFQRISRRYQIENSKKKLLTYEVVK